MRHGKISILEVDCELLLNYLFIVYLIILVSTFSVVSFQIIYNIDSLSWKRLFNCALGLNT